MKKMMRQSYRSDLQVSSGNNFGYPNSMQMMQMPMSNFPGGNGTQFSGCFNYPNGSILPMHNMPFFTAPVMAGQRPVINIM